MKKRHEQVTDEQWSKIEPLLPKQPCRSKGGRPRADDRLVFEGILWMARFRLRRGQVCFGHNRDGPDAGQ